MECRQAVHKDSLFSCIVHNVPIHLVWHQYFNPFRPGFIRFSHGYPNIGVDDVSALRALHSILFQSNAAASLGCDLFTFFHQLRCREEFLCGTGCKVHSHLRTGYHKRIAHIVAGITHISHLQPLGISEMFLNGQKIRQHLCRMEFIGKAIPYRNTCIFCQFLYDFLPITTILDSFIHASQYSCSIFNAFLFADLGTGRVQICSSHSQVMSRHLKRAACSGRCFFKNQCDIFTPEIIHRFTLFLFFFQSCCQIQKILNLLRCIIKQFQKMSSL